MPSITSGIVVDKQDVALPDSVDNDNRVKTAEKDMQRLIHLVGIVAGHLEVLSNEEIEEGWR